MEFSDRSAGGRDHDLGEPGLAGWIVAGAVADVTGWKEAVEAGLAVERAVGWVRGHRDLWHGKHAIFADVGCGRDEWQVMVQGHFAA
jgi:hypothetical protein